MQPYAALDRIHMDPDHPVPALEGSAMLRELPSEAVDVLLERAGPGSTCPLLLVELRLLGGALARGTAGAVGSRDAAYDLVFVDADKSAYAVYYEQAVRMLRPGGVVAFDNMLWHDRVADPTQRDTDTVVLRDLAKAVREDDRLVTALLAVGDGLLVAAKR